MPNDILLVPGIYAAIGAISLIVLRVLYKDYRTDKMRDELFAARDELFDYATAEGLLSHPGYRHLRLLFNSMLRYSHKITFFRLSLSIAFERALIPRDQHKTPFADWLCMIKDLPNYQQDRLREFHNRLLILVLRYIVDISLVLAPIAWCVRRLGAVPRGRLGTGIVNKTEHGLEIIEGQALQANR